MEGGRCAQADTWPEVYAGCKVGSPSLKALGSGYLLDTCGSLPAGLIARNDLRINVHLGVRTTRCPVILWEWLLSRTLKPPSCDLLVLIYAGWSTFYHTSACLSMVGVCDMQAAAPLKYINGDPNNCIQGKATPCPPFPTDDNTVPIVLPT